MGSLLVVVGKVVLEIPAQATHLGHEAPCEGRSPALLEDRPLHPFDRTVRLWSTRMDAGLDGADITQGVTEAR